ncbi:zinc finger protein 177-like [Penaeus monodon]|uniref:zinc finger protein 177-like n=1 Tax=Penaeus monodon TaxID=6687 RepID=UPI0018A7980D|nr:zinc finger protein 177-like [Penaeus monodon]
MSFLGADCLRPHSWSKKLSGIGVSVKEEISEDGIEDTCLEIKEDPLDYGDEARNDVCNMEYSCNLDQDCSDMSKVSFWAKDCGKTCSSDGVKVMCEGRQKEDTQLKVEKPYNFEICNKTFPSKSDLEKHVDIHTERKPYNCEICKNTFLWKSYLVRHMRTHTKEKPYSCEICNNAFSCKKSLLRHMRTHTKEKPYKCGFAIASLRNAFLSEMSSISHIKYTQGETIESCRFSYKAFSYKGSLDIHMQG